MNKPRQAVAPKKGGVVDLTPSIEEQKKLKKAKEKKESNNASSNQE